VLIIIIIIIIIERSSTLPGCNVQLSRLVLVYFPCHDNIKIHSAQSVQRVV